MKKIKQHAQELIDKFGVKLLDFSFKTLKINALKMGIPLGVLKDTFIMALSMVENKKDNNMITSKDMINFLESTKPRYDYWESLSNEHRDFIKKYLLRWSGEGSLFNQSLLKQVNKKNRLSNRQIGALMNDPTFKAFIAGSNLPTVPGE